jgi:type I restriction enzyme, S subunit
VTLRVIQLGDVLARVRSGVSPVCSEGDASEVDFGVLKLSAITGGRLNVSEAKSIAALLVDTEWPRVRAGTLLITRASGSKGLVGACVLADRDFDRRIIPDTAWELSLKPESGIPIRWVLEFLKSPPGRRAILEIARGTSGIWKINKASFNRIRLPVPTQRQMEVTSRISERYESTDANFDAFLTAKRELKSGLMSALLTGRQRMLGCREPAWIESPLGDLFAERNETGHPGLRLLSVTADRGIVPREEVDRKDTSNADKSKYQRVCIGDIAYNTMRMWQGVSALSTYEGIVSPAYTVLIPRGGMLARYARHLFKLPRVVHTFWRYSQGLVDDTLSLKYPNLARIALRYPADIAEQSRIADILDSLDRELALLDQLRVAHQEEMRALMQRLLSGALTVPASRTEPVHA